MLGRGRPGSPLQEHKITPRRSTVLERDIDGKHIYRRRHSWKWNVFVFLISLQVCLTAAVAGVIFSHASSREPPLSPMPHTSAQGLNEGVWLVLVCPLSVCMRVAACVKRKGGGSFISLSLPLMHFYLSEGATDAHMHGCTRLEFICTTYIFIVFDDRRLIHLRNAHLL